MQAWRKGLPRIDNDFLFQACLMSGELPPALISLIGSTVSKYAIEPDEENHHRLSAASLAFLSSSTAPQ